MTAIHLSEAEARKLGIGLPTLAPTNSPASVPRELREDAATLLNALPYLHCHLRAAISHGTLESPQGDGIWWRDAERRVMAAFCTPDKLVIGVDLANGKPARQLVYQPVSLTVLKGILK